MVGKVFYSRNNFNEKVIFIQNKKGTTYYRDILILSDKVKLIVNDDIEDDELDYLINIKDYVNIDKINREDKILSITCLFNAIIQYK